MNKTLIIDGDGLCWRACALHPGDSESRVLSSVRKWIKRFAADRAIVCFSDSSRKYWRQDIWPAYKAVRKEQPEGLERTKDAFIGEPRVVIRTLPRLEADDLIGMLATSPKLQGERIIISDDNDMACVPGRHYQPRTNAQFEQDNVEARYAHLYRTLTGKGKDGFPGLPKVGKKKATEILNIERQPGWESLAWIQVVKAFVDRGHTAEDALIQARVARILHAHEYDLEKNEVILWEPPWVERAAVAA